MKLLVVLTLCALAAAAPSTNEKSDETSKTLISTINEQKEVIVNALVHRLLAYLRFIISNGSFIFGTKPVDPLVIEEFHIYLPTGLINLDLHLKDAVATGFGDFIVNRSQVNMNDLTLDMDVTIPIINISAGAYDFVGDLYSAIPLYGKGDAKFVVEGFRLHGLIHLAQSQDGEAIVIDRIVNPGFEIPVLKSDLTGVIGGGDIDNVVNAIIEEVILDYINRFESIIAHNFANLLTQYGNPVLGQLETWKYVVPLLPIPSLRP